MPIYPNFMEYITDIVILSTWSHTTFNICELYHTIAVITVHHTMKLAAYSIIDIGFHSMDHVSLALLSNMVFNFFVYFQL